MTTLVQWEPLREMVNLRRRMDRVFDDTLRGWDSDSNESASRGLALDVAETEQEYKIEASIPGIKPEEIDITMNDNTLTISGESKRSEDSEDGQWHVRERYYGRFSRSIRLPIPIEEEQIDADYEDGILTVHLPKSEKTRPRKISVNANGEQQSTNQQNNKQMATSKQSTSKQSTSKQMSTNKQKSHDEQQSSNE